MSVIRNVVVIVADQLRADHLGCGGGPIVTPNLDSLAARAIVFDNAYVANPTCMPNRATIATGRWPTAHGTHSNGLTLDWDADTFMRAMQRSGWQTAAVGKLHFQTMGWPYEPYQMAEMAEVCPELLDEVLPDAAPRPRSRDWDQFEEVMRHRDSYVQMPDDYYGFDHVDLVVGHGDRPSGHYHHWALAQGLDPMSVRVMADAANSYPGWDEVYQSEVPVELHPTSYVTTKAVDRLDAMAEQGDPFLLFVSYPDPHHPFAPPGEYWHKFDPAALPLPHTFLDAHEASPEHVRRIVQRRGTPNPDPTMTWSPTEEQFREAYSAELGLISMIDRSVGAILDRLDQLGCANDTAIVFTSDHGDLFGDHGLMLKHFVHYRGVTRVPLMVAVPGADPQRNSSLVSSADIAPTLLGLGEVAGFRGIQGQDLSDVIHGRVSAVRGQLLVEEDQPFGLPGLAGPVRMRTLLTESARLTTYGLQGVAELYDLAADPDELVNLAGTVDGARLEHAMLADLVTHMAHLSGGGVRPAASA